jgi:pilus assembly protein CpaB
MRRGNLFVLLLALVMGGIAAFLARNWIAAQAHVQQTQTGTIVVASAPLGFGTVLDRDNIREIAWPAERLPDGAFATKNELMKDGRRAMLTPVARDEPILKTKITGPDQRASLSALLEEGKRAVTVRVDDVRGVAGFVLPGDRVDVVLIRAVPRPNSLAENISDVLLQHVKVLAVDQLVNERQEKPTIAKAVTLEVSTDQAQKILLATNIGKLSLILRQAGETDRESARRITENDLYLAEVRPPATPQAPATPKAALPHQFDLATVEVVRAMKSEKYSVMRSY